MRPARMLLAVLGVLLPGAATADSTVIGKKDGTEVVTVRVPAAEASKQGLPIFAGVSGKTAGARGMSMLRVVIPPGGKAKAHIHKGYETAVYLIQGRVETRFGEGLKKRVVNQAGDFIYIPSDVPHQPFNLSQTEPAIAIVARTDPNEQESVVLYPHDK
ncbi:MAG: cupin domain-containing protein [Methyloligellaceae bacterium]